MRIYHSNSIEETKKIAKEFAATLKGGECIAFFGGMGMGKTAFIKALVKALGNDSPVSSPTFAIVNDYGGKPRIYHFDMYRIESWDDLYSTGFFEYSGRDSILMIEWSEKIENALDSRAIRIYISAGESENERNIEIRNE